MDELTEFTKDVLGLSKEISFYIHEHMWFDPTRTSNVTHILNIVYSSFIEFLDQNKIEYVIRREKGLNIIAREEIRMTISYIEPMSLYLKVPLKNRFPEYVIQIKWEGVGENLFANIFWTPEYGIFRI